MAAGGTVDASETGMPLLCTRMTRRRPIRLDQQAAEKLCGHARASMVRTCATTGKHSRRIAARDSLDEQDGFIRFI